MTRDELNAWAQRWSKESGNTTLERLAEVAAAALDLAKSAEAAEAQLLAVHDALPAACTGDTNLPGEIYALRRARGAAEAKLAEVGQALGEAEEALSYADCGDDMAARVRGLVEMYGLAAKAREESLVETAGNVMREWAYSRWVAEVKNRPQENIHRRTLDETWRQVEREAPKVLHAALEGGKP
jgi:hypothetical protein